VVTLETESPVIVAQLSASELGTCWEGGWLCEQYLEDMTDWFGGGTAQGRDHPVGLLEEVKDREVDARDAWVVVVEERRLGRSTRYRRAEVHQRAHIRRLFAAAVSTLCVCVVCVVCVAQQSERSLTLKKNGAMVAMPAAPTLSAWAAKSLVCSRLEWKLGRGQ